MENNKIFVAIYFLGHLPWYLWYPSTWHVVQQSASTSCGAGFTFQGEISPTMALPPKGNSKQQEKKNKLGKLNGSSGAHTWVRVHMVLLCEFISS